MRFKEFYIKENFAPYLIVGRTVRVNANTSGIKKDELVQIIRLNDNGKVTVKRNQTDATEVDVDQSVLSQFDADEKGYKRENESQEIEGNELNEDDYKGKKWAYFTPFYPRRIPELLAKLRSMKIKAYKEGNYIKVPKEFEKQAERFFNESQEIEGNELNEDDYKGKKWAYFTPFYPRRIPELLAKLRSMKIKAYKEGNYIKVPKEFEKQAERFFKE